MEIIRNIIKVFFAMTCVGRSGEATNDLSKNVGYSEDQYHHPLC
jgi:hypothetical protein